MKLTTTLPIYGLLALLLCTCDPATEGDVRVEETENSVAVVDENPAADGFNLEGSDAKAVAIADSIVKYHGGRAAYDNSRYFKWNFFGARTLTWDKEDERVRIEVPGDEMIYLLDYSGDTPTGAVSRNGEEMTNPDSLAVYLERANSMFINDSYWLVQPFKLKDSGVTLYYEGEETDPQKSRPSEVIEMTFAEVGNTPGNRYRLYVDKENYRINTWEFFRNATDEKPSMQTPYDGYADYNGVLLSGDRSGRFQLGDIAVTNEMDDSVFTDF